MAYLFGRWVEALARVSVGEHQVALDHLLEDVPFAERTGIILMYLRALNTVGFVYGDLHDYERALEWNHRGLEEALAAGLPDPEVECNAALNLGDNLDGARPPRRGRGAVPLRRDDLSATQRRPSDSCCGGTRSTWLHSYGELMLLRGDTGPGARVRGRVPRPREPQR